MVTCERELLSGALHAKEINVLIPECRRAENWPGSARSYLLHNLRIAGRVEPSHAVAVEHIDAAFLAAADEQMRNRAALIGQSEHATCAKIEIVLLQRRFVKRRD